MKRLLKIVVPLIGHIGIIKYFVVGIISGLCGFLFINTVTRVIGHIMQGGVGSVTIEYLIIFCSIILLYVWTRKTLSLTVITLSQRIFWTLRKQLLGLILNADYQQLQSRRSRIHASVVSDVNVLTDASFGIIQFFTSLILCGACLAYMASISVTLFFITLAVALFGVGIYYIGTRRNLPKFQTARNLDDRFMESFISILDGFKEIFMEPKKGKAVFDEKIRVVANEAYRNNTSAFTGFLNNQITGQVLFYALIASVLLIFSIMLKIDTAETVSFVFTLLYLLTSIESLLVLMPSIMRARVAAGKVMDLKNELEQQKFSNPLSEKYYTSNEFRKLSIRSLEYYYGEQNKSFGIGPVSMDINAGETIFIYGGNGSGKTTFVHNIIGLRNPSAGEIKLNGTVITPDRIPEYKTLFGVLFSDFYLFNELLGLESFDKEKWDYYLKLFEIEGKVNIVDKVFTTTDLSTGQRKRLALIATLMENKPILVIDEWAADQDPFFRKKFYTKIIPELKKGGLTIIAITHDDKYYHCADSLYKMEDGRLVPENLKNHQPPPPVNREAGAITEEVTSEHVTQNGVAVIEPGAAPGSHTMQPVPAAVRDKTEYFAAAGSTWSETASSHTAGPTVTVNIPASAAGNIVINVIPAGASVSQPEIAVGEEPTAAEVTQQNGLEAALSEK